MGLLLLDLAVARLCPAGAPLLAAVDDTLLRRSGRKVFGCHWRDDAAAKTKRGQRSAWGNNWVCLGPVVQLPFPARPLCLPLPLRLRRPGEEERTKPKLARELVELVAKRHPERKIVLLGDAATRRRGSPACPSGRRWRRAYAAAPPSTPKRRPGGASLAGRVRRASGCLRRPRSPTIPGPTGRKRPPPATASAPRSASTPAAASGTRSSGSARRGSCSCASGRSQGFDLALVSSDLRASAAELVERRAKRWAIEVAFEEAKQLAGVGQAHNRSERAVRRTAPFGFLCLSLAIAWYALYGHASADVAEHRAHAPWYRAKAHPSVADMLVKLRRTIIAAQFRQARPPGPTQPEIPPAAWLLEAAVA